MIAAKINAKTVNETLRATAAFTIEGLDIAKHLTAIPGPSEEHLSRLATLDINQSIPMEWSPPVEREPFELFTAYSDSEVHSVLTFDGEDVGVEATGHIYVNEEHMFRSLMDSAAPNDYGFAFGAGLLHDAGTSNNGHKQTGKAERFAWLNCGVLTLWDSAEVVGGRNGEKPQPTTVLEVLNSSMFQLLEQEPRRCFQLDGRNSVNNRMESLKLCTDSHEAFLEWFPLLRKEQTRLQKMAAEKTCEVKKIDSMPEHRASHICHGSRCKWVVESPWSLATKLQAANRTVQGWWRATLS